jgi:hypothetical protein
MARLPIAKKKVQILNRLPREVGMSAPRFHEIAGYLANLVKRHAVSCGYGRQCPTHDEFDFIIMFLAVIYVWCDCNKVRRVTVRPAVLRAASGANPKKKIISIVPDKFAKKRRSIGQSVQQPEKLFDASNDSAVEFASVILSIEEGNDHCPPPTNRLILPLGNMTSSVVPRESILGSSFEQLEQISGLLI